MTWRRRELENYLCTRETLLVFAQARDSEQQGELFGIGWRDAMSASIDQVAGALATLGRPSPWGADLKVSDDLLDSVFSTLFKALEPPNLMRKTDDHTLAPYVPLEQIDREVSEKLDAIVEVSRSARGDQ